MYWPSISRDAEYRYEMQDSEWLDADEQLMRYTDRKDPTQWPVSSRKTDIMTRLAKKQGDPTEKPELSSKGTINDTINNAYIIITCDSKLKGKYYYDEFRERPVVAGDLPWQNYNSRNTDCRSDFDDSGLRQYLEKGYGLSSGIKIKDAIDLAMQKNKRHPVKEYLDGLMWDGTARADSLFIDYLGAEDSEYTREVTRKALIGAVARIYAPGCKHDHMLVLVGPQGCRKSTTLARLGGRWFSDSLYTVTGKDAYEQLQGYRIIEMSEMAATRKAELEQRLLFYSEGFGPDNTGTERREVVCAMEIWQELFKGDPKNYTQTQAREINSILRRIPGRSSKHSYQCGKLYGRQSFLIWEWVRRR